MKNGWGSTTSCETTSCTLSCSIRLFDTDVLRYANVTKRMVQTRQDGQREEASVFALRDGFHTWQIAYHAGYYRWISMGYGKVGSVAEGWGSLGVAWPRFCIEMFRCQAHLHPQLRDHGHFARGGQRLWGIPARRVGDPPEAPGPHQGTASVCRPRSSKSPTW